MVVLLELDERILAYHPDEAPLSAFSERYYSSTCHGFRHWGRLCARVSAIVSAPGWTLGF